MSICLSALRDSSPASILSYSVYHRGAFSSVCFRSRRSTVPGCVHALWPSITANRGYTDSSTVV